MKKTVERLKTYVASGALGKQNPRILEKPLYNYQDMLHKLCDYSTVTVLQYRLYYIV